MQSHETVRTLVSLGNLLYERIFVAVLSREIVLSVVGLEHTKPVVSGLVVAFPEEICLFWSGASKRTTSTFDAPFQ